MVAHRNDSRPEDQTMSRLLLGPNRVLWLVFALMMGGAAQAQMLFPNLTTPSFRGTTGTEYTQWDIFQEPYAVANYGDYASGASSPTLTQTLTDTAFITSGFNIYSFSAATGYVLDNTLAAHPNNVVFQFETLGTSIDYSTLKLNYVSGGTTISLSPANMISENRVITGGFGGFTTRAAFQWDLTGLAFTSYTITFQALGSSNSFNLGVLDTSTKAYTEVVPSARTWDGGGDNATWGDGINWTGNTVNPTGGNVTFASTAPSAISLNGSRTVGQMTVQKTGAFTVSGTAGSTLTVDTGIALTATGTTATISAPVFLGGHGFFDIASGSSLALSGVISGAGVSGSLPAAGIYKTGLGELGLTGNNTFLGGVTVDGGTLRISGSNLYTGASSVISGKLLLQSNALNGSGALGVATTNVAFGSGVSTGATAEIILDGDRTMARAVSVSIGDDIKRFGAQNTTSGATFSGAISFTSTTNGVRFTAQNATDKVTFSGALTGGDTSKTIIADGLGEVVLSGSGKTYSSATTVQSGTLRIASGTAFTGVGAFTVGTGASLMVDGSLEGTGSTATLTVTGGVLGGSGTIKRPVTISSGSILSPGNSVGTLSFTQPVTFGGAGHLRWEMNDVDAGAGTGWDTINITGALNLTATSASRFVIDARSLTTGGLSGNVADFNPLGLYSWTLVTTSGGITGFNANEFSFDLTNFTNAHPGTFSVSQVGNNLLVNYVQITPEPSRALLFMGGLAAILLRRRR